MTKYNHIGIILWMMAQILYAQNSVVIGKIMYQNQAFTVKINRSLILIGKVCVYGAGAKHKIIVKSLS